MHLQPGRREAGADSNEVAHYVVPLCYASSICSDCRTRTYDPAVNSRQLYQLS